MSVELEDQYTTVVLASGAEVEVILDAPFSAFADLQSGTVAGVMRGLKVIVHAHPFTRKGEPLDVVDLPRSKVNEIIDAYGIALASAAIPKA